MEHSFHTVNFSPMFGSQAQLPDVLRAANEAGFTSVGLDIWGVEAYLAGGARLAGLPGLLDDNGLSCTDVLAISIGPDARQTLRGARRLAEIASVTGARVCVGAIAAGVDPLERQVRTLLRRCTDIMADVGARLALEFLPYSPLKTVAQAKELCDDIGSSRAGLLLDSWHTLVGRQLQGIVGLPASAVAMVQFSDALTPLTGDLQDGSRNLRRMPGEGNLKLRDFVETVKATGYSGLVSPEVLSARVRQGPPLDFARSVRAAMIAYWE
jgi:sugar phosphate isomerase/epimerase